QHRREPGAHLLHAVVPRDEVDREEGAGEGGVESRARRPRPVAPILAPREPPERRQRPEAAEERARRRRDVGEPEEDPGEGDAERADERGQHRRLDEAALHRRPGSYSVDSSASGSSPPSSPSPAGTATFSGSGGAPGISVMSTS